MSTVNVNLYNFNQQNKGDLYEEPRLRSNTAKKLYD